MATSSYTNNKRVQDQDQSPSQERGFIKHVWLSESAYVGSFMPLLNLPAILPSRIHRTYQEAPA